MEEFPKKEVTSITNAEDKQAAKDKEERQGRRKGRRSSARRHNDHKNRPGHETKENSPSHRKRGRRSSQDEDSEDSRSESEKISSKPLEDHSPAPGHSEVTNDEEPPGTHLYKKEKRMKTQTQPDIVTSGNETDKLLKKMDDQMKPKIAKKSTNVQTKDKGKPSFLKEGPVDEGVKANDGIPGSTVRVDTLVSHHGQMNSSSEYSDSEEWTDIEIYESERDDEWLQTEKEEVLENPTVRTRTYFLKKKSTLDIGCAEFMKAMKFFWWWLKLGGRMPFQTYTEDRIVKFKMNRNSFSFIYFALTSAFLTICTTTIGFGLLRIIFIRTDKVIDLYHRVERLEVDKYWIYALVTFITCTISSSVSLATIFDEGFILADFLTRWNLAISTIKYRPVKGLRAHFWINSLAFLVYATVLIFLFFTDTSSRYHVPAVRGAAGLIGTIIIHPFFPEARLRSIFPHLERLGLFVHLYSAYSSKAILLMVTIYCKALVNMSRKWNLRLAYVLETLGKRLKSEKIVIPFQKLFLEHTVIVGFLRHTGRIFAVGLGIFYTLKMAELMVLCYRVMSYIIFPLKTFNGTVLPGTPESLPPVSFTDPPGFLVGTAIVMLLISLTEWFITSQLISKCGETILDGFSSVRRFGLVLSKTSQRRRFVQSLNHAFSHATDYHIKSTFTINRPFIFNTVFWLITMCALLTAFSPFQLHEEAVTVCSERGNCVMVRHTRIEWRSGGSKSSKEVITVDADRGIKMMEKELTTESSSPITTTATPTTRLCRGVWYDGNRNTADLPNICFSNGSLYPPYVGKGGRRMNCTDPGSGFVEPFMDPFDGHDCISGAALAKGIPDSCKNIQLPTPEGSSDIVPVRFDFTDSSLPKPIEYVLCCYNYGTGFRQLQQLRRCNQIDAPDPGTCSLPTDMSDMSIDRYKVPYRFDDLDIATQSCFRLDTRIFDRSGLCDEQVIDCLCGTRPPIIIRLIGSRLRKVFCPPL